MRSLVVAACVAATALGVSACSSDAEPASSTGGAATSAAPIPIGSAPVLLDRIRPAVEALEAQLGGPQQYFEINATISLVNLFVATEGATEAVAYVYTPEGTLEAAEPMPASGPTFAASEMTFDETRVMALTVAQLPSSTFLRFAATGVAGGGVTYSIVAASALGTEFTVTVGPTGAVLGTDDLIPGSVPGES